MVEIKPKEEMKRDIEKAKEVSNVERIKKVRLETALIRKLNRMLPNLVSDAEILSAISKSNLREAVELIKIKRAFWDFVNIQIPQGVDAKAIDIKFSAREDNILKFDVVKDGVVIGKVEVLIIPNDELTRSALYEVLESLIEYNEAIKSVK